MVARWWYTSSCVGREFSLGVKPSTQLGCAATKKEDAQELLKRSRAGLTQGNSTKRSQVIFHALCNTRSGDSALKKGRMIATAIESMIANDARINDADYSDVATDVQSLQLIVTSSRMPGLTPTISPVATVISMAPVIRSRVNVDWPFIDIHRLRTTRG
jgi:hypothetical protein